MKKVALVLLFTLSISMVTVVFTLYRNDRLQLTRITWRKCANSTATSTSSARYLWCINHYGPNNQLRDFVKCCVLARLSNYTVVLPPLFPHYGRRKTPRIQWFDHFYDIQQLSRAVNLVTVDQFIAAMKTSAAKLTVDCYVREFKKVNSRAWYAMNTLNAMQRFYKVRIDFRRSTNISRYMSPNEIGSVWENCSSVLLHVHYTTFGQLFLHPNPSVRPIFQHLHRTPLVQRMASQLIAQLPELITNNSGSEKNLTTLAAVHMRLGDYNVMSVSAYIQQISYLLKRVPNFTHLHIMCPYLNSSHIAQLNASLPVPFTTSQDLLTNGRFLMDDFLFDVLEQEIAYQAPIFLASPWTTYSATVLMQKVLQDQGQTFVLSRDPKRPPVLITKKTAKYFP